jgi:tetratricopeptide (TPR) repeat protein
MGSGTGMGYPTANPYPINEPEWANLAGLPPIPKPGIADDEKCFPWKISETQATAVSVARLQVPSKARSEFEKACDATTKSKFSDAEQHARNAIGRFQNYAAAWVELGLVLEGQAKPEQAYEACSHAVSMDSTYLAGYLCEAEFSVRSHEWKQVLDAANQAEGLNAEGEVYVFYYRAKAYLQMNNLAEAKKNALEAERADVKHSEPFINLALAHIYEREGDNLGAIAELQKLLKQHADPAQATEAKAYLARLESTQPSK